MRYIIALFLPPAAVLLYGKFSQIFMCGVIIALGYIYGSAPGSENAFLWYWLACVIHALWVAGRSSKRKHSGRGRRGGGDAVGKAILARLAAQARAAKKDHTHFFENANIDDKQLCVELHAIMARSAAAPLENDKTKRAANKAITDAVQRGVIARPASTELRGSISQLMNEDFRIACAIERCREQWSIREFMPYLEYEAIGDGADIEAHPSHQSLSGMVLRVDDPFWREHYPPCGKGCSCMTIQLDEKEARKRGIWTKKRIKKWESYCASLNK